MTRIEQLLFSPLNNEGDREGKGFSESHRAGSFILQLHSSCSSLICDSMKIIVYQAGHRERKSLKESEKKEEERRDREGFNWIGRISLEEWSRLASWRKGENKVKMGRHWQFLGGQLVLPETAQTQAIVSPSSHPIYMQLRLSTHLQNYSR